MEGYRIVNFFFFVSTKRTLLKWLIRRDSINNLEMNGHQLLEAQNGQKQRSHQPQFSQFYMTIFKLQRCIFAKWVVQVVGIRKRGLGHDFPSIGKNNFAGYCCYGEVVVV